MRTLIIVIAAWLAACGGKPDPYRSARGHLRLSTQPSLATYIPYDARVEPRSGPQQPGETAAAYSTRRAWLAIWERFEAQASMSPRQRRAVLWAMGNAQVAANSSDLLDEQARAAWDMEMRLRRALTDEQYRRWDAALGRNFRLLHRGRPLAVSR